MARLGSLLELERSQLHGGKKKTQDGQFVVDESSVGSTRVQQLEIQIDYLHENIVELEKVFLIEPV
jgi:hypothetical protein